MSAPKPETSTDTLRHRTGARLARRARSFKQDFLDKLNQIRSPSATRSSSPHKHYNHHKHKGRHNAKAEPVAKLYDSKKSQKTAKREKDINHALTFVKQLSSALRYFQDVVEKDKLEQLSGSVTIILEIVLTGYQELKAYLINNEQSSVIISATNQVYQSLAELIRWSDSILLKRDKSLDKESVGQISKDVYQAVDNLVQLCIDRYKNRDSVVKNEVKSQTGGHQTQTLGRLATRKPEPLRNSASPLRNSSPHRSSLPEIPLSPREQQILESTSFATPPPLPFRTGYVEHFNHSRSSDDVLNAGEDVFDGCEPPPPKPPMPLMDGRPASLSDMLDMDEDEEEDEVPPPLPPKRLPRTDRKVLSSQNSFDWSHCQSSNCTSVDSCLNYSGLNHLSADDLLSIARDVDSSDSFRQFRSQTNSYNTTSSSEENRNTNSYNFSQRYAFKTVTQSRTTTAKTFEHSVNSSHLKDITTNYSLNSPPFSANHRMDGLINKMRRLKTSLSEDTVDGDLPPQLPVKMRPKISVSSIRPLRPPTEYDNVDYGLGSVDSSQCGLDLLRRPPHTCCPHSQSCPHFRNETAAIDPNDLENRPPPLPPKKRNIMAYMQMVGSYNGPDSAEFYRHSVHTYQLVQSQLQAVEMSFLQQRSITTSFVSNSSDDSVFSFESELSSTPPPLLPPKKRKATMKPDVPPNKPDESPELIQRTSTPVSLVPSSESGISSQSELTRVETEVESEPEEVVALDQIDVSTYIVFKSPTEDGPEIRGGTIDGLIVKATEVSKNDFMFQEAFLTTYRTLVSPLELVEKLLYRYNKFILMSDMRQRAAKNAFALLVRVVDDMCLGDCTDRVLELLMDFIYQLINRGDLALAKVLRAKCIEKMEQRQRRLASAAVLLPSINVTIRQSSLSDFKSDHLAEQMTLLDSELFLKIEIPEVLVWAKEQKEELIPNLNTFTEHFNKMSYWTRSRILEQEDAKERERLILKFIKIMKHLRKLSNFNSYLAILSALDSAPVRRLEWQRNITESLKEYSALIDSSSSFRAYRQALADTEPPCIPYIGLILQDLTFVHIGNNDYLPDGNINFGKRWQQYNILDQMRRFRNCHYPFKRNDQIIGFFDNFEDYLSEEAMWQISESIKPRGVTKK